VAEFKITNSKIEQLNDNGDNYKVANNSAPVAISGQGVVQTAGEGHDVKADQKPEGPTLLMKLWEYIKAGWKYVVG
jgi:hypothetical protein